MLTTMTLFLPPDAQIEYGQPSMKIDVDDPADLNTYLQALSSHNFKMGQHSREAWIKEAMTLLNEIQQCYTIAAYRYEQIDKLRKELKGPKDEV
jgi:hypothetical protein